MYLGYEKTLLPFTLAWIRTCLLAAFMGSQASSRRPGRQTGRCHCHRLAGWPPLPWQAGRQAAGPAWAGWLPPPGQAGRQAAAWPGRSPQAVVESNRSKHNMGRMRRSKEAWVPSDPWRRPPVEMRSTATGKRPAMELSPRWGSHSRAGTSRALGENSGSKNSGNGFRADPAPNPVDLVNGPALGHGVCGQAGRS
jgi:hypothetical protein